MMNSSVQSLLSPRVLGAVAIMMMSIFSQRADAMSPGNPGAAPAKARTHRRFHHRRLHHA